MGAIAIDMRVTEPNWTALGDLDRLCQRALDAGAASATPTPSGEISLLLTDDAEMRALNAAWRGKDAPTDVLSFPAGDHAGHFLGDIALGYGTCARDAASAGRALADHTAHMLIHGLFHLLGHDHEEASEAAQMEALEIKALASLGVLDPYS